MKKLLISAGVVILLIAGWFLLTQPDNDASNLDTELTTAIELYETADAQFTMQYNPSEDRAQLSLNGVQHNLEKRESVTGTRYESSDGSVVFFATEGQGNVEIDGELIFENANLTERRVEVLKSNKQGDPDANKYDFNDTASANNVDNDCDDPNGDGLTDDSTCASGDPVPGIGISGEAEVSDGSEANLGPATTEADSEVSAESDTRATDYNSSRSNRTTSN